MWTVLALICLVSSFDIGAAKDSSHPRSFVERSDSTETRLKSPEETPVRLPRRFMENSRTRRLHIENQTGFDGKVGKIHINAEEDLPGIRAYGLQKKKLMDNGYIERMLEKEIKEELNGASRVTRSVEAYGKSKEHLDTNGRIERIHSPASYRSSNKPIIRVARSVGKASGRRETGNELDGDLEAQDAKIFRPLFVYRQQVAKRQQRLRNQSRSRPLPSQPTFYVRGPFF